MERRVGLRAALMGQPLGARADDPTPALLDAHVEGVRRLLPRVYGSSPACTQAVGELGHVLAMPHDADGTWCRRAAVLFAVGREPEVADFFAEQERRVQAQGATFSEDMRARVLPLVLPRFVKNSCQAPDSFVVLALVLAEMWAGEPLGNWPRAP